MLPNIIIITCCLYLCGLVIIFVTGILIHSYCNNHKPKVRMNFPVDALLQEQWKRRKKLLRKVAEVFRWAFVSFFILFGTTFFILLFTWKR